MTVKPSKIILLVAFAALVAATVVHLRNLARRQAALRAEKQDFLALETTVASALERENPEKLATALENIRSYLGRHAAGSLGHDRYRFELTGSHLDYLATVQRLPGAGGVSNQWVILNGFLGRNAARGDRWPESKYVPAARKRLDAIRGAAFREVFLATFQRKPGKLHATILSYLLRDIRNEKKGYQVTREVMALLSEVNRTGSLFVQVPYADWYDWAYRCGRLPIYRPNKLDGMFSFLTQEVYGVTCDLKTTSLESKEYRALINYYLPVGAPETIKREKTVATVQLRRNGERMHEWTYEATDQPLPETITRKPLMVNGQYLLTESTYENKSWMKAREGAAKNHPVVAGLETAWAPLKEPWPKQKGDLPTVEESFFGGCTAMLRGVDEYGVEQLRSLTNSMIAPWSNHVHFILRGQAEALFR